LLHCFQILFVLLQRVMCRGVFVSCVADNVIKFAAAIPAQSLVDIAVVLALIFMLSKRIR
jgi:hypothetical protein